MAPRCSSLPLTVATVATALCHAAALHAPPNLQGETGGEADDLLRAGTLLAMPEQKLALCTIPKVGYQNFNDLFNQINGRDNYQESEYSNLGINWDDVTKENGWTFALFTRDPLERYLSAWGSKCLRDVSGHVEAGKCSGDYANESDGHEAVIQAFEQRVQSDLKTGLDQANGHFMTQVSIIEHCDPKKFDWKTVDFRGSFSDGKASIVVHRMLKKLGVLAGRKIADAWFPLKQIAGHSSDTHGDQSEFYRKRETVLAVYQLYKDDYEQLELELPPILKKALRGK